MLYTIQLLNRTKRSVYLDRAYHNYVCDRSSSIMNRGVNERIFTDLIPNLYDRSVYLRGIGREHLAYLEKKLKEGRKAYPAVFGVAQANPNEYRKMKLFLRSPRLYLIAMRWNDALLIPLKVRLSERKKDGK